jgi:hypothetical protein
MPMVRVGDDGAVGGSYKILYQRPDILIVGVNNVQDAMTVTAQDGLYGVVFSFTRSIASWEGGLVQVAASFYAGMIQTMAAQPHVVGLTYTQDTNASGNLVDQIAVTVGSDDETQEATFVWPLETIGDLPALDKVTATYDQLMAVANSTGA